MADIQIRIENLPELRANLRNAPKISAKWLGKAVTAAIFEIKKQAVDDNFQFVTPRAKRTGYLALSFGYGMQVEGLTGKIGPTAEYAPYVYYGTSRGISPNPYMDRIAKAATPNVQKHFNEAINEITNEIAHV